MLDRDDCAGFLACRMNFDTCGMLEARGMVRARPKWADRAGLPLGSVEQQGRARSQQTANYSTDVSQTHEYRQYLPRHVSGPISITEERHIHASLMLALGHNASDTAGTPRRIRRKHFRKAVGC